MNWRPITIACLVLTFLIGAALIVLGALVIDFVNTAIDDGVKKAVKINKNADGGNTPDGWSDSSKATFLVSDRNWTYHAFEVVDSGQLSTTTLPKLKQQGPYTVNEVTTKFAVSWSEDGTTMSYNDWWIKHWTEGEAAVTGNPYKLPNPAYLAIPPGLANRCPQAPPNEKSVLLNFPARVLSTLKTFYNTENGTFVAGLRVAAVPAWINAVITVGTSIAFNYTTGQIAGAWTTGAQSFFASMDAAAGTTHVPTAGFALNSGLSAALTPLLFETNKSSPLIAASVVSSWPVYLASATDPTAAAAIEIALNSTLQDSAASNLARLTILGWMQQVTNAGGTGYVAYTTTMLGVFGQNAGCGAMSTWSNIGACQFGSGSPSNLLASGAGVFSAMQLLAPSTYTAACTGLTAAIPEVNCKGQEIGAYLRAFGLPTLSVAQAELYLNTFSNSTNVLTFAGYAAQLLGGSPAGAAVCTQFGSQLTTPFCGADFPNSINSTLFGAHADYLLVNLPNIWGFIPLNTPNPASNPFGTGLFARRTPYDLMFGYTVGLPNTSPRNDPLLIGIDVYPGILSNWTSQDDYLHPPAPAQPYGPTTLYTGSDNINRARAMKAYRGYSSVASLADINKAYDCRCSACNADLTCNRTCDAIWAQPEIIDGFSANGGDRYVSDGTANPPLTEGSDAPLKYFVFSNEAQRVIPFVYARDSEVKGIKTRRYVIDPNALKNAFNNPSNVKFQMYDPDGVADMHWWNKNAPIALSQPFFINGNQTALLGQFQEIDTSATPLKPHPNTMTPAQVEEEYGTWLEVEPLTGFTILAHQRLQYVVRFSSVQHNNPFSANLFKKNPFLAVNSAGTPTGEKAVYWPAMWADQTGVIKDSDASDFRKNIYDNRKLAENLQLVGLIVGSFLVVLSVVLLIVVIRAPAAGGAQRLESKTDTI